MSKKVVIPFNNEKIKITIEGENCDYWSGIFFDALIATRQPARQQRLDHCEELVSKTLNLIDKFDEFNIVKIILRYRLASLLFNNVIKDPPNRNEEYERIANEQITLADEEIKKLENNELIKQLVKEQT